MGHSFEPQASGHADTVHDGRCEVVPSLPHDGSGIVMGLIVEPCPPSGRVGHAREKPGDGPGRVGLTDIAGLDGLGECACVGHGDVKE